MVLPAYFVTSGLGSKLSRWLVPPIMNSQMTRLARGAKCGLPSGAVQGSPESTVSGLPHPSRCNSAPNASPVKPIPRSARNARRGKRRQLQSVGRAIFPSLPDRDKIVVVDQHVDQVLARPLRRVLRRRHRGFLAGGEGAELRRVGETRRLLREKRIAGRSLGSRW